MDENSRGRVTIQDYTIGERRRRRSMGRLAGRRPFVLIQRGPDVGVEERESICKRNVVRRYGGYTTKGGQRGEVRTTGLVPVAKRWGSALEGRPL